MGSQKPGLICRAHSIRRMRLLWLCALVVVWASCIAGSAVDDYRPNCRRGCRREFAPVCGADGHTYSSACIAECQDVEVALERPCPGEALLHPTNAHVLGRGKRKSHAAATSSVMSASTATLQSASGSAVDVLPADAAHHHLQVHARDAAAAAVTATAGPTGRAVTQDAAVVSAGDAVSDADAAEGSATDADVLPLEHLQAFRHEGYRYAGQMSFSQEPLERRQRRSAAKAAAAAAASEQQAALRAVRVTREGHVYVADLDESVQVVLDQLIERSSNGTAPLVNSLRQWRAYRGAAGADRGRIGGAGGGAKFHEQGRGAVDHAAAGGATSDSYGSLARQEQQQQQPKGHAAHLEPVLEASVTGSSASSSSSSSSSHSSAAASPSAAESSLGPEGGAQGSGGRSGSRRRGLAGAAWDTVCRWSGGVGARLCGAAAGAAGAQGSAGTEEQQQHQQARRSLGIFDGDDRVDCPRTPTYPFTAAGQISIRDSTGNYVCSGTLVGPDVVLTAAHCVFNRAAQAFYDRLDFAPGRYRTLDGAVVSPFGVVPWTYVTVYQSYSSPATSDPNPWDIAILKLSQRIGVTTGWMGVFEPCNAYAPTRYAAVTAGYPSDMPAGSCKTTQCGVVQEPCTDPYLYHKCDTASGQSGSPMWMMAMTQSYKMGPYVRAVHNIEWVQEAPGGGTRSYINSAVGITPDHYRSILAWIAPSFESGSGGSGAGGDSSTPMGPALPPKTTATAAAAASG